MSSSFPQSTLRCPLTFAPAREPSQIFTRQEAPPTLPGEPCIGPRCGFWVAVRNEKGEVQPIGCAVPALAGNFATVLPVLTQIAAAWHNDRIAAQPAPSTQS